MKREGKAGAVHRLPADLKKAIASDKVAKNVWADITPLAKMRKGMRRPCCWPGCPHR